MPKKTKTIPMWKVKRELNRVKTQLEIVYWVRYGAFARWKYDRTRQKTVVRTPGKAAMNDEVAVYLLYQPDGIAESSFMTLEWLIDQGIAPVVVSNAPLSVADKQRLLALSTMVITRPNIGYDFGGYREGVLSVLENGMRPKALYVFNDSIWFPLHSTSDIIQKCREDESEIFGLHLSYLLRSSKWNEHIQSYFFRFSEHLVSHISFENYWRKIPLMQHKRAVVRHLERQISWHFAKVGFSFGALSHWKAPIEWFLTCKDEKQLLSVFQYYRSIGQKEADILGPLLDKGLSSFEIRDKIEDLIKNRRLFTTIGSTHPKILIDLKFPFLKRTRTSDLIVQRQEFIRLGLISGFDPIIQEEIRTRDL